MPTFNEELDRLAESVRELGRAIWRAIAEPFELLSRRLSSGRIVPLVEDPPRVLAELLGDLEELDPPLDRPRRFLVSSGSLVDAVGADVPRFGSAFLIRGQLLRVENVKAERHPFEPGCYVVTCFFELSDLDLWEL